MSQLTTHVLDTARGKPAAGIRVVLHTSQSGNWLETATGITNPDGRIPDLLPQNTLLAGGTYKLTFFTQFYFDQTGTTTFYPYVEIVFQINSPTHYHIPLLISPFGYTTYRGS